MRKFEIAVHQKLVCEWTREEGIIDTGNFGFEEVFIEVYTDGVDDLSRQDVLEELSEIYGSDIVFDRPLAIDGSLVFTIYEDLYGDLLEDDAEHGYVVSYYVKVREIIDYMPV